MKKIEVYKKLPVGKENAITARELSILFDCPIRDITNAIQRERREHPICANSNAAQPGYYLARDFGELQEYCNRLWHREKEVSKTRKALLKLAISNPVNNKTV